MTRIPRGPAIIMGWDQDHNFSKIAREIRQNLICVLHMSIGPKTAAKMGNPYFRCNSVSNLKSFLCPDIFHKYCTVFWVSLTECCHSSWSLSVPHIYLIPASVLRIHLSYFSLRKLTGILQSVKAPDCICWNLKIILSRRWLISSTSPITWVTSESSQPNCLLYHLNWAI